MGKWGRIRGALAVLGVAAILPGAAQAAPSTDTATSLAVAGDGSGDVVVLGGTSPDGSGSDIAAARVNPDGTLDSGVGGGDGRARHDLGRLETVNEVSAGPGGSFTFTGNSSTGAPGGDILVGRVDGGLGLDPSCGGDGAEVIDLGATERGDLIVPFGTGYIVAGVRDGVAIVIRLNADCTLDQAFGVQELDFGAEGDVVAVHDILVDPVTNEISLAVELATDAGVVQLEPDGDPDPTFSGDGLARMNMGSPLDRFTGVVEMGGLLYVVGDNGTDGQAVRIDGTGVVQSGPVAFDLGTGSDVVNGTLLLGGHLLTYGGIPGTGFSDSAAAQIDANTFALVPAFAGDGNASFDPGGGLNLLNDGVAVGGRALVSAVVDNAGTQSFDFGIGAIGPDGALAPDFNGGQFLLIDFEGQTGASGGAVDGGSTPPGGGPPRVADFSVEQIDLVESAFVEGFPVRPPAGAPAVNVLGVGRFYYARVTVKNNGPDRAAVGRAVLLSRDFPGGTFSEVSFLNTNTVGFNPDDLFLNPGESLDLYLQLQYGDPRPVEVRAEVFPNFAEDRNPDNNRKDSGEVDVYSVADSRISRLRPTLRVGDPYDIEGRAVRFAEEPVGGDGIIMRLGPAAFDPRRQRVTKVEVALLRVDGSARAVGRRPRVCRWLRNSRARIKRIRARGGRCDRAVWLRAKGTTRWRFRLTRGLPAGRYVVYSRATNAAGLAERSFTRRDGNRVAFRVRR